MNCKSKINLIMSSMIILVCLIWSNKAIAADITQHRFKLIAEFPVGEGPDAIDLQFRDAPFGAPVARYLRVQSRIATVDNSGSVYLITAPLGKVVKFDSSGDKIKDIISPDDKVSFPFQLALDIWDNLYVFFHNNGTGAKRKYGLAKFDSAGELLFWLEDKKLWENRPYWQPLWSMSINGIFFIRERVEKIYRKFSREGHFIGEVDYKVVDAKGYVYSIPEQKIHELPIKRYFDDKLSSKDIEDLEFIDQRQLAPSLDVPSRTFFKKFDEEGNMYFGIWTNNYEELSSTYYPKLGHSVTNYIDTGCLNIFKYNYERNKWYILERQIPTSKDHKYCVSTGIYITPQGKVYETFLFLDDPSQLTSKDRLRIYRWEKTERN